MWLITRSRYIRAGRRALVIKLNQKTSQVLVLVGFIYGAGSSTYFLAWHIFVAVSHRPFPLSLFRNEVAFLGWAIIHSIWYFLAFQEREATNVRWGSVVNVNPRIEEFSRAVVALCVWYFCIVLLWQIMIPLVREH